MHRYDDDDNGENDDDDDDDDNDDDDDDDDDATKMQMQMIMTKDAHVSVDDFTISGMIGTSLSSLKSSRSSYPALGLP